MEDTRKLSMLQGCTISAGLLIPYYSTNGMMDEAILLTIALVTFIYKWWVVSSRIEATKTEEH